MKVALLLVLLVIFCVSSGVRFVTYVGQAGPGWGTPGTNEDFLKYIGVPGYGLGSMGYNIINFAFWVSNSNNGGAAVNGAAYDWQNILSRITSSSLRRTLTGTSSPSAAQLRAGIKSIYEQYDIKIFISAFGGADHPMGNGKNAITTADALAAYAKTYNYDGVDVDWEEGISGKLGANGGGEQWLCSLTNRLRNKLNSDQQISHAPQAPYFRCSANEWGCNYPNGGYTTVHANCGGNIDFYNVQFYNQGSTKYDSYNELFVFSSGWSTNSAIYQIVDKGVPASKLVCGKHTYGDGSTFVSGTTLKSIFTQAIAAGRWNAGFMTWQFYREVTGGLSNSLIGQVSSVTGWGNSIPTIPTLPTTTTTTTPRPTVSTTRSASGNIIITNVDTSGVWFYAARISGVTPGYIVNKFEIRLSDYSWHSCDAPSGATTWWKCQSLNAQISLPFSARITASSTTLTSLSIITSFNDGVTFDFGKNFASSVNTPTPTNRPTAVSNTPRPTPRPTARPTARPTNNNNGGGGSGTRCKISNRGGSGAWWLTFVISDIPSGITIESVKMRPSNNPSWESGTYYQWGNYWAFNKNAPYSGPFSFKIKATTGQEITSDNVLDTWTQSEAGIMDESFSQSYSIHDDDNNDNGLSWTVWFAIIVIIFLCVIGLIVGIFIYNKKQKRGKAYIADSTLTSKDGNNTFTSKDGKMDTLNTNNKHEEEEEDGNDAEKEEMEIEVEMQHNQPITATND